MCRGSWSRSRRSAGASSASCKLHRRPEDSTLDFSRMWWHPPVSPRAVFESERVRSKKRLGLVPLVSVTDHDDILAGLEMQTLVRAAPRADFGRMDRAVRPWLLHLGVHNLPSASAEAWFARLAGVTARPSEAAVTEGAGPIWMPTRGVLLVLNHPQWDLAGRRPPRAPRLLHDFLDGHASRLHALELNGSG